MRIAPLFVLTLLIAAAIGSSTAQAAGFNCSATAARITVLGQTVDPITANANGTECIGVTNSVTGDALKLPAPISAAGLVAATQFHPAQKAVVATGGIADLSVPVVPSLPIALPDLPQAVKDAVAAAVPATIDLTAVKTAIPTLPTNLVTNLPTTLGIGDINLSDPALDTLAELLALNEVNTATNTANAATNAANQAVNDLRASIPDSIAVDASILDGILKLPNVDLLRVRSAIAYAAGSCLSGTASVSGSSTLAGISILGQEVNVGQAIDRLLEIKLDAAAAGLALGDLGLSAQQAQLIAAVSAAQTQLNGALTGVNNAIKTALAGVENLIPPAVAQVQITPGAQVKTGDSITQQALNINVTLLGQQLLSAVIGEAKTSAAGVDCATAVIADPNTPEGATLSCSTRRLVLVDVLERGGRVKLFGVADPSLVGKRVAIVFNATGRTVAHARVDEDGSFDTTAPLPPRGLRDSNDARYMATLGKEESINLKLRRRMIIDSMTAKGRRVTITGRVVRPLAQPAHAITLRRQVSCNKDTVVKRFKPSRSGRFRITVLAPKGLGTAVYRMTTKVRNSSTGTSLFETFTLPRAVDLDR